MLIRALSAAALLTCLLLASPVQAQITITLNNAGTFPSTGSITYASVNDVVPLSFDIAGDGGFTEADSHTWTASQWDASGNLTAIAFALTDDVAPYSVAPGVDLNFLTNGTWNAAGGTANGTYTVDTPEPLVIDDFDDGNADGWFEANTPGVTETYAVVSGAYQITAAANGNPLNPPRAGSSRIEATATYSDFALRVDVTDFAALDQAFGQFARQQQIGTGTTDGYVLAYDHEFNELVLTRVTDEAPAATLDTATGVTLDPLEDYRLVFEGTGTTLTGTLYELPDLTTPLATVSAVDATYTSGQPGLFAFDDVATNGADVTFDNVVFGGSSLDRDGDGLSDLFEIAQSLDPLDADSDGDGLDDGAEVNTHGTDPLDADSDGDGLDDGAEINTHASDPLDVDSDDDGVTDFDELRVFAFATSTTSGGDLGGLAGADATCDSLASAAGLGTNYRAWLSTDTTDARDRIQDRVYQRVDGGLIASSLADLTDGSLAAPIELDETGAPGPPSAVWTGTLSDGTTFSVFTCGDWNSNGPFHSSVGDRSKISSDWTDDTLELCSEPFPHYCFGFDSADPNVADSDGDGLCDGGVGGSSGQGTVGNCPNGGEDTNGNGIYDVGSETDPNNPDTDGDGLSDGDEINIHGTDPLDADSDDDGVTDFDELRVFAFVTSTSSWGDLGGLAGADATCDSLASAAGLGTNYDAWLSAATTDARDRIQDRPYQRVDGVLIASNLADLTDGSIAVPIELDETGAGPISLEVWTGTTIFGSGISDCFDWTNESTGEGGITGFSSQANSFWTQGINAACPSFHPHYCFGSESADPNVADSDGDGLCDGGVGGSSGQGTVASCPNGGEDTNGNGVYDIGSETDPNNPDTDGDGFSDGDEVAAGSDPLDPMSVPNAVPALPIPALVLLAGLLACAGRWRLRQPAA